MKGAYKLRQRQEADQRLLDALEEAGELTVQEAAYATKRSVDATHDRLHRLLEEGLVRVRDIPEIHVKGVALRHWSRTPCKRRNVVTAPKRKSSLEADATKAVAVALEGVGDALEGLAAVLDRRLADLAAAIRGAPALSAPPPPPQPPATG